MSAGAVATVVMAFFCVGFLRDYTVLTASLTAYGVSTIVCISLSLMSSSRFDFSTIQTRVGNYDSRSDDDEETARLALPCRLTD